MIDGKRLGVLSGTQIGALLRDLVRKRPSVALQAEIRRDEWRYGLADDAARSGSG